MDLGDALELLGGATWQFDLTQAKAAVDIVDKSQRSIRKIEGVALFSGGVDSSCGAATLKDRDIQLCSFYTRQKTRQLELARALNAIKNCALLSHDVSDRRKNLLGLKRPPSNSN